VGHGHDCSSLRPFTLTLWVRLGPPLSFVICCQRILQLKFHTHKKHQCLKSFHRIMKWGDLTFCWICNTFWAILSLCSEIPLSTADIPSCCPSPPDAEKRFILGNWGASSSSSSSITSPFERSSFACASSLAGSYASTSVLSVPNEPSCFRIPASLMRREWDVWLLGREMTTRLRRKARPRWRIVLVRVINVHGHRRKCLFDLSLDFGDHFRALLFHKFHGFAHLLEFDKSFSVSGFCFFEL